MFLGTFGFRVNLVRTARTPKRNVFGHIRASGQFGLNRAPPTHPPTRAPPIHPGPSHLPTHPGATHPPTHLGATHPPTHAPGLNPSKSQIAENECFWAHSGFSPIWSEHPECRKGMFLGTFGLQPNLVRIAKMPNTNIFGHVRASAQFGRNSRNAEYECFWAHSGFSPTWSE